MFKEFRAFIARGSVVDLAIGVIIGTAFGKVVTSLVNDVIMPPIGLILNQVDFSQLYVNLSHKSYATLDDAKAAGAPTLNYGAFINNIIDFLIIAVVVYLVVVQVNRMTAHDHNHEATPVTTKPCPYCLSDIPLQATRCGHCTSVLTDK